MDKAGIRMFPCGALRALARVLGLPVLVAAIVTLYPHQTFAGSDTVGLFDSAKLKFFLKNANTRGETIFKYKPDSAERRWIPIAGNWTGGKTKSVGFFDPAGNRFVLYTELSPGAVRLEFKLEVSGTNLVPLVGDWKGRGIDTVGLYDPVRGAFHLRYANSSGPPNKSFRFGARNRGRIPIVGDFNGDGIDTIGLYYAKQGRFHWAKQNARGTSYKRFFVGPKNKNWQPLAGDWDGDSRDTVGFYDPDKGVFHLTDSPSGSERAVVVAFDGANQNSRPVVGDWDAAGGNGIFLQEQSGLVAVEAENLHANSSTGKHSWRVRNGSVGKIVQALPQDSFAHNSDFMDNSPRMDFVIRFLFSGTHYVWVRTRAPDSGSDTLEIGFDGKTLGARGKIGPVAPRSTWVWQGGPNNRIEVPGKGLHTLHLWMRESGIEVDKIVVTSDPGFIPGKRVISESSRDDLLPFTASFTGGRGTAWFDKDQAVRREGVWLPMFDQLLQLTDFPSGRESYVGSYHVGSYSLFLPSMALQNYRFTVDLGSSDSGGNDIGVMFRYRDDENFYRFSMNSRKGFRRLEKVVDGKFQTLADDSRGYDTGATFRVAVEVQGNNIEVLVNDGYPTFPEERWEPLFGAVDSTHQQGGVALYARGPARFDNLKLGHNDRMARTTLISPSAYTLLGKGPLDVTVAALVSNLRAKAGNGVRFEVDRTPCSPSTRFGSVYVADCKNVTPGDYRFDAIAFRKNRDVARDSSERVGVTSGNSISHAYVAIGDSITHGTGDNYSADNQSPTSLTLAVRGYPSQLSARLSRLQGGVVVVQNEGVPGDTTRLAFESRLQGIQERHREAKRSLVMLGTNDASPCSARDANGRCTPRPSGAGCPYTKQGSCSGTYKGDLFDLLGAANYERIYLPLLPPGFGDGSNGEYDEQTVAAGIRNVTVRAYNFVISQEATADRRVRLGPDFYSCFLGTRNRYSVFDDRLHPNGLGFAIMSRLWEERLLGAPARPGAPCGMPIYIVEDLKPYGFKQNLLEVGDEFYQDRSNVLTSIPPQLLDGRWIMTRHSDRNRSNGELIRFEAGNVPVTVFLAVDPQGSPPVSNSHQFSAYSKAKIRTEGGAVKSWNLYRATNVTGRVSLGGNLSGGSGAREHYLVIVVPN